MGKKYIYISADYANEDGDRQVVEKLNGWAEDNYHVLDFVDMAKVVSGSISVNNPDCRPCQLKKEFNDQINKSSIAVFIVGDMTKYRTAGSSCGRATGDFFCTPYKQNSKGSKLCNNSGSFYWSDLNGDINPVNSYSYLRHEFEQAKKKGKKIVIFYNSTRNEYSWLPFYMKGYENCAMPFWTVYGRIADYYMVKKALGYE